MSSPYRWLLAGALLLSSSALLLFQDAAHAESPDSVDDSIARAALERLGGHGGQCKTFARDVVEAAAGVTIGAGYRQGYLDAGGVQIDPTEARAGDVLQIAHRRNGHHYYPGMHTAIVVENLGKNRFMVVDSNWRWDERVRMHEWSPAPTGPLRLYAYRFDDEPRHSSPLAVTASEYGEALQELSTAAATGHATTGFCAERVLNQEENRGVMKLLSFPVESAGTVLCARNQVSSR